MRFDFKKIASVFASAVMLGSTAGIALAANYPAPLITGGAADGAIVITSGDHAGSQVDFWAAIDLQTALQGLVTAAGTTSTGSITGEAYPLYTSGTKIYYNDTIKKVKSILTDTELPTILADQDISGNVDADITQTISLVADDGTSGRTAHSYVTFDKQPTGDEDPQVGLKLSTTKGQDLYNLTVTLDKAVNFTHSDTEKQTLTLFGQKFTVGVSTDDDDLYLYKSSETFTLSVGGSSPVPSKVVTVEGKEYTVELTAATDSSATLRITDSDGNSEQKEINEGASKKIQGVEVAVNLADESTATDSISSEVTVGAQKLKFTEGNEIKIGSDETAIEGTNVNFAGGGAPHNLTKIVVEITAPDSDSDAIIPGGAFIDPVFGTFKIDFAGLNINEDSTARDTIEVKSTDNTATLKMTTHTGDEGTITWYHNKSQPADLADSNGHFIHVLEMDAINESEYVVVGNEDEGYLIKVDDIQNGTTGYADDAVKFSDVFSGKTFDATITAEGSGSVTIGGKQYDVYYNADKASKSSSAFTVRLNYPDSTTASSQVIVYPTIQTSKGAKVAFYKELSFNITSNGTASDFNRTGWVSTATATNITKIRFPDGDGYQDLDIARGTADGVNATLNWTISGIGTAANSFGASQNNTLINVTQKSGSSILTFNITAQNLGQFFNITLQDPGALTTANKKPALIIFEEEDDNNDIQAIVVKMEGGGDSNDEVGVSDVMYTFGDSYKLTNYKQLETDDDLYKYIDLWGAFAVVDKSESSQYTATLSYPDEQIYAQIYAAEVAASIGVAVAGGGGQILVVKDSDVSSVSGRNLVVVGGSCINAAAAKVLGVSMGTCGADFTAKTNVGAGQYLIKAVQSPYNADKTAVLVAGYEAADTKNAAAKLKESHDTSVGTSTIYPITSA